jgi:hypothetical protein
MDMPEVKLLQQSVPVFPQTVPTVYSNGFIVNVGASDVSIIMMLDASPAIKLHLSYTSAKTLQGMLSNAVKVLEDATNHNIMESGEVEAGLRKLSGEGK